MNKLPKKITITIYEDPGHAWAKVDKKLLSLLGIADKITTYSYQSKNYAFLEEDCDLGLFIKTCRAVGIEPIFKTKWTNKRSKIRSYNCYVHTPDPDKYLADHFQIIVVK
jgi:hypothetical protein